MEPPGILDGRIDMDRSFMFSDICPVDKTDLEITHKIVSDDNNEKILRWNVRCPKCGRTGVVHND